MFVSDGQLHRIGLDGGDPAALTGWRGVIAGHLPLAERRLIAVIATDEPDEEDERRKAQGDDAIVWGRDVPPNRLRLLDLAQPGLTLVGGWATATSSRWCNAPTAARWP